MNTQEALALLDVLDSVNPYAKRRGRDELARAANTVADLLPDTPVTWAVGWCREVLRRGDVPAIPDIADAWHTEAQRRITAVPVPRAPEEVENDPARWRAWERARRRALMLGANDEQSQTSAARAVGAPPPRALIGGGPSSAERTERLKAEIRGKLAAWAQRQQQEFDEAGEDL